MTSPKVLVTGASGFVGEALLFQLLIDKIYSPVAAARRPTKFSGLCPVLQLDLDGSELQSGLNGIQVVIHAAARVHVMTETANDALAEFRKVNVEGTLKLARRAAICGVRRFIFISSIKVNGEITFPDKPFKADDAPNPADSYGVSKYEAEEGLKRIADETGMEVVIIRPPLIYGPGVKANFLNMLNWLERGIPLPLGSIRNQRSLVSIGNLVDFLIKCIDHPAAANQTFLISDGEDLSITQLLTHLSGFLGRPSRLVPCPQWVLALVATVFGKQAVLQRVCSSLQVDISKNRDLLGWTPPVKIDKAMRQTAGDYLDKQTK